MDHYHCIVIGESVASLAASLALAPSGLPFILLADAFDSGGLDNIKSLASFISSPAPHPLHEMLCLNDRLASNLLSKSGTAISAEQLEHGAFAITLLGDRKISADWIIVAPFGTEVGLPDELKTEELFGRGVSYDASSDGPFFRDCRAVVAGHGLRGAEQALIAAQYARSIVIIDKTAEPDFGPLHDPIHMNPKISVLSGTHMSALLCGNNGNLAGINIITPGGERLTVETDALFVAQGLEFRAELFGGANAFSSIKSSERCLAAGLAAGIPYNDIVNAITSGRDAAMVIAQSAGLAR